MNHRPHANANFLVDLGYGDPNSATAGFCEVIFPEFRIDVPQAATGTESGGRSQRLILRRGVTGTLDLYEWWNQARRGEAAQTRTVTIALLADDHSTAVVTWHFHGARPVSLSYSPLNAMDAGVLIESIELAFDSLEMR
jgi:phage tail-like protein